MFTELFTKNKNVKTSTKFTTEVTELSTLTATKVTDTGVTDISSPTAPITKKWNYHIYKFHYYVFGDDTESGNHYRPH